MSQPIEVGSVLGGRYQVTEFVMTTAEGDLVLEGIDQVLNRSVSILVASIDNSSQLASSARDIAMEERMANVQVLDLGVTEANQSYLVTNMASSADLLDLVIANDAPYVEPFYTDTLGTEIFGESRQAVPQTYDDDDEYYEHLADEDEPQEQGRIGNALSSGLSSLGGLKNRFGRKSPEPSSPEPVQQRPDEEIDPKTAPTAAAAGNTDAAQTEAIGRQDAERPVANDDADPKTAPNTTAAAQTVPSSTNKSSSPTPSDTPKPAGQKPKVTRLENDEPHVTATAALSSAELSKGKNAPSKGPSATRPAAAAAAKPDAKDKQQKDKAAAMAASGAASTGNGSKPKTFPAAAKGVPVPAPAPTPDKPVKEEESSSKGSRLLVGAVLIAVLVIGVVFAFNFLGGGNDEPVAQSPSAPAQNSQPAAPTEADPSTSPTQLPAPEIVQVSRLVPGNQKLNVETDGSLPKMIDGNPASAYNTYSYTTPNFGGFASNMVFILELADPSKISEITLDGLNASGGSYQILIGDTEDLGEATSVANGSFTGPSLSVPVSEEQSTGQYVFLNVTELPRRASGANPSRPYGLQLGEFSVK